MMYLLAPAELLLCHRAGLPIKVGANHLFMPEAQHQNFEECTIFGCRKQTPDLGTS